MQKQLRFLPVVMIWCVAHMAQAQIAVSPARGGTGICTNNAQNRTLPYGVAVALDTMIIRESAPGDFAAGAVDSVRLQIPTGWVLWSSPSFTVSVSTSLASELDSVQLIYNIDHITLYVRAAHTSLLDTIYLSGFGMVPATDMAPNAHIYPSSVSGMPGITTGPSGTNFCSLSVSPQPIIAPYHVWCTGTTPAYDSTPGGTWSSMDTTVATIDPTTGVITPQTFGIDTIIYKTDTCWVKYGINIWCEGLVPAVNVGQDNILLYPSPARNVLTVQTSGLQIAEISITNMLGQTIYQTEVRTSDRAVINVAGYPPGIYLVRINNNQVRKWVKE